MRRRAGERAVADYDVESYWSRVATEIMKRGHESVVAGDDNLFFRCFNAVIIRKMAIYGLRRHT